jgi:hypothetical protein
MNLVEAADVDAGRLRVHKNTETAKNTWVGL